VGETVQIKLFEDERHALPARQGTHDEEWFVP
jgi:hypothetical protein